MVCLMAWLLRTAMYGANVASIGLASSFELNTTVMPFILRGISLLGVNSVATPRSDWLPRSSPHPYRSPLRMPTPIRWMARPLLGR